jgi:hypothetical protein
VDFVCKAKVDLTMEAQAVVHQYRPRRTRTLTPNRPVTSVTHSSLVLGVLGVSCSLRPLPWHSFI